MPDEKREILAEMAALFIDELAADEWGRILVSVRRTDGVLQVVDIAVEEIVGDERKVDAAFDGPRMREILPIVAKATEALAALEGVDLDEMGGGTFVRLREGGFWWLPGLVRVPSMAFDRVRDEIVARTRRFDARGPMTIDLDRGEVTFGDGERAGVVLAGTYVQHARTFAWGWSNKTIPEGARRASAELTDLVPERDVWEISTPVFTVDEATALSLVAFVCDRAKCAGVFRTPHEGGHALFIVR